MSAFACPLPAVDEVTSRTEGKAMVITAVKRVLPEDPYMAAHFPGLTIYPASFLLESARQAVAAAPGAPLGEWVEIRAVRSARLLAPVRGGELVTINIRTGDASGEMTRAEVRCTRGDGTLAATLAMGFGEGASIAGGVPEEQGTSLGYGSICDLLPLGHPLVLVDRVAAVEPGHSIVAIKAVSGSEPCFHALPPGSPQARYAYPVSLLIESFAQAAALLWLIGDNRDRAGQPTVLMPGALRGIRVSGTAFPGDVMRHEIRLVHVLDGTCFLSGESWVAGHRVLTVESLVAVRRPRADVVPGAAPRLVGRQGVEP